MTKKHFQKIADAMKNLRKFEAHDVEMSEVVIHAVRYSSVVDALATVMADSNPRFDRDRFLEACGINTIPASDGGLKRDADRLKAAQEAIDNEDQICFDVAANAGQHFSNVKNTDWFLEAVAEAL